MIPTQTPLDIEGVRRFHGHSCPGLTMGIRISEIALNEIGPHSVDEEVVCIIEADNCAVDAIQYFTGCTFGKGNLIHHDYGKNVFTFIRRSDGKAVRIALRPEFWSTSNPRESEISSRMRANLPVSDEEQRYVQQCREQSIEAILDAPLDMLFEVRQVEIEMPEKAQIHESITCTGCGESIMSTRVRTFEGNPYCIPCFETRTHRS